MKPLTRIIDGVTLPLYRLRTAKDQTLIHQQVFSNTTGLPNPGPDQEFLPIMIDDYPTFDNNFSSVVSIEQEKNGEWQITYVVTDKTKEEILKAVDEARRDQVAKVVPGQDFTETNTIAIAAIIHAAKLTYAPEEQVLIDAVTAQAAKLADNRVKADAAKVIIQGGGIPDLKGGWAVSAIAEDVISGP